MKKLISAVAIAVISLSLAACGSENEDAVKSASYDPSQGNATEKLRWASLYLAENSVVTSDPYDAATDTRVIESLTDSFCTAVGKGSLTVTDWVTGMSNPGNGTSKKDAVIFAGAAANAYCPSVKAEFDVFLEASNIVVTWQDWEPAIRDGDGPTSQR
ncbi:DUF732 domain-containing protein [Arthrobacter sp. TWP1-1]|uniref:DUF732 domain-containing protein n=1 Tax=Arthrobacter sp. TWP1-1 TaxID=2804568 RepID=UPI003CF80826